MSISDAFLNVLRNKKRDLTLLYEFYTEDKRPGADGFDPADAVACFAASRREFRGKVYLRSIQKHAQAHRSSEGIFNSVSITFSGIDGVFPAFATTYAVEGMHLVVRLVSRGLLVGNNLKDTLAIFTGECEKPQDADKKQWKISAKQHIGSTDVEVPPRTYTANDANHAPTDPLYEGFPFIPMPITLSWQERVRRGGIGGLIGLTKKVTRTLQYTSTTGLDENEVVPIVLGRAQMALKNISSVDTGTNLFGLYAACDGGSDWGIQGWQNLRTITPGFSMITFAESFKYGKPGGIDEQLPDGSPPWPGARAYSRTAYVSVEHVTQGAADANLQDVAGAPEMAAVILGTQVPLPDATGAFTLHGFSDNPAILTRWLLTDPRMMALPPEFIDDAVCVDTASWCDQYLYDEANTDRIGLPVAEETRAGINYRLYQSMGRINPAYFRSRFMGDTDANPYISEVPYEFFDPTDPADPTFPIDPIDPITQPALRRRWTVNCPITEKQKAIDFLNNIVFAASRLFLVQGTSGKIEIRVKRPVDGALLRGSTAIGAVEVPVESVLPWRTGAVPAGASADWYGPLRGKVIIGLNLLTGEARKVTGTRFSTAGNSITLAATGGGTASGATFTGGNGANVAASAYVDILAGIGAYTTITIDGVAVSYVSTLDDDSVTTAAALAARINAHPTLGRYVKAVWDSVGAPQRVSLSAKLGFLQLNNALQAAHSPAEEVIRVDAVFTSGASTLADAQRSNVLKDSVKFPLGGRQSTINQLVYLFRDSVKDFQLTELRVNDEAHQASMGGKKLKQEVNGTACDNYHQAVRAANSMLAELRDGDYFVQLSSDGEALLLDEGRVVAVTTTTGGFINLAIRLEDVSINGDDLSAVLIGRRYLSSMYSDTAEERKVPIPTTLAFPDSPPPQAVALAATELGAFAADGTWKPRIRVTFSFAAFVSQQRARVQMKRTSDPPTAWRDLGIQIHPDASNNGTFDITDVAKDSYDVRVITETAFLRADPSGAPTYTINVNNVAPAPAPINGTALRDLFNFWRILWDKGAHFPDVIAQGEEFPEYVLRIFPDGTFTGAPKREVIIKTAPWEYARWTQFILVGFPCAALATPAEDGGITHPGAVSSSGCIWRSQLIHGDARIRFKTTSKLPPRLIRLVDEDGTTTEVYWENTYAGQVPMIQPAARSDLARRPVPGETYTIEIRQQRALYIGPQGEVIYQSKALPITDSYFIQVEFGGNDAEPMEAANVIIEPTEPEIFWYTNEMQVLDFGAVQNTIYIELRQRSQNPSAPEGLPLQFVANA
jgi:hypothetical protein